MNYKTQDLLNHSSLKNHSHREDLYQDCLAVFPFLSSLDMVLSSPTPDEVGVIGNINSNFLFSKLNVKQKGEVNSSEACLVGKHNPLSFGSASLVGKPNPLSFDLLNCKEFLYYCGGGSSGVKTRFF